PVIALASLGVRRRARSRDRLGARGRAHETSGRTPSLTSDGVGRPRDRVARAAKGWGTETEVDSGRGGHREIEGGVITVAMAAVARDHRAMGRGRRSRGRAPRADDDLPALDRRRRTDAITPR